MISTQSLSFSLSLPVKRSKCNDSHTHKWMVLSLNVCRCHKSWLTRYCQRKQNRRSLGEKKNGQLFNCLDREFATFTDDISISSRIQNVRMLYLLKCGNSIDTCVVRTPVPFAKILNMYMSPNPMPIHSEQSAHHRCATPHNAHENWKISISPPHHVCCHEMPRKNQNSFRTKAKALNKKF